MGLLRILSHEGLYEGSLERQCYIKFNSSLEYSKGIL
jgi:hypothetical protein